MIKFTKMQGLGNDYIYINCLNQRIEEPSKTAKLMSDRHFGIGSDGIVLILPSKIADFKMRMFNSDGSEAEMCGNAIRCVGKYVFDNELTKKPTIEIETLSGIKILVMTICNDKITQVKVDMGEPILDPKLIPVIHNKSIFLSEYVQIENTKYSITCVSIGNPHAIIFVDDVNTLKIKDIGPKIETHGLFPKKIN